MEQYQEILAEKIQEGVEVRLLFDDFGSLMINTEEFRHELAIMGVRFGIFSPIHEGTSRLTFNYRNHQKLPLLTATSAIPAVSISVMSMQMSMNVSATGRTRQCAWKGTGVWGLTCIFLEMWEFSKGYEDLDYKAYKPEYSVDTIGYVQPMATLR